MSYVDFVVMVYDKLSIYSEDEIKQILEVAGMKIKETSPKALMNEDNFIDDLKAIVIEVKRKRCA